MHSCTDILIIPLYFAGYFYTRSDYGSVVMMIIKSIGKHLPVWITILAGFVVTSLLVMFITSNKNELAKQDFYNTVHELTDEISEQITTSMRTIYHLSSFFQGSEHVTHEEFDQYVSGFINQYPEIHALEWAPRIPHEQRRHHEQQQAVYKQGYTITEKPKDKGMVRAAMRDYYFPITYIYPMRGNESAFGYDLASNPIRKNMLKHSVITNTITLSSAIRLVQEKNDSNAVLIAMPITKTGKVTQSLDSIDLQGMVLGVFRINTLMDKINEHTSLKPMDITISEYSNDGEQILLYRHPVSNQPTDLYSHSKIINVANRKWQVDIKGNPKLFGAYTSMNYLFIFFIGLGFTALLAAYIHLLHSSQERAYQNNVRLSGEINKRKQYEKKLIKSNNKLVTLSREDAVMKIANRRAFNEYLMIEWKRSKRTGFPLSLIIADVDNFKAYNDHYGHVIGDHCLRNIAEAFRKVANRPSDMAARYGGEEIAVILPETSEDGAKTVAESICQAVSDLCIPHENSSTCPVVTVSLGVTTISNVADYPIDEIVKSADAALYLAKQQGKNRVVQITPGEYKRVDKKTKPVSIKAIDKKKKLKGVE